MKKVYVIKGGGFWITIWHNATLPYDLKYSIEAVDDFGLVVPARHQFRSLGEAKTAAKELAIMMDGRQAWMAVQGRICEELYLTWVDNHPGGSIEQFIASGDFDAAYRARTGRDFLPQPPKPESFV